MIDLTRTVRTNRAESAFDRDAMKTVIQEAIKDDITRVNKSVESLEFSQRCYDEKMVQILLAIYDCVLKNNEKSDTNTDEFSERPEHIRRLIKIYDT